MPLAGRAHHEKLVTELLPSGAPVCTHQVSALAAMLRRLRETAGLTQEELAERAGVSARTISDTERGLRARIYADTAGRLARALDLDGPQRDEFVDLARGRITPPHDQAGELPHPLTPLLGRSAELGVLTRELDPGSLRRLVTVTGLGGTGKTRLAVAAATQLQSHYEARPRFVALAAVSSEQLEEAIAAALSTTTARLTVVADERPTLLVLDAFEHVADAADRLADLLSRTSSLRVLATSRTRLGLPGERELPLGPLPPGEAAELFLRRARDVRSDLVADDVAVADICSLTSGLPLPLELAAAQVRYLPVPVLRDRLRGGLADANRVVQDAVAWSISSLSAEGREVLAAAAMFVDGCRLDALTAVCDPSDVIAPLAQLVDGSLVTLDESGPVERWRMLDAVRDAAMRLVASDARRRRAYTDFYLAFLRKAGDQLGHEQAWYQQLAAEEANLRTALGWAEAERAGETLLQLATGMWLFWQSRGALDEGRRWLASALDIGADAPAELRATAWWGAGWLAYHQADDDAAERAGEELARLASARRDQLVRRNAATIAGMVAIARDDPHRAIELLTEALQLARTAGSRWILATSLLNLGLAQLAAQDPDRARPVLGEALAHYDELGDVRFHARSVGYLGLASLLDGDPERARALFVQSFTSFADLGEAAGTAEALAGLAAVEAAMGDPLRAAVLGGTAERIRDSVSARELPLERGVARRYLTAAAELAGADWAAAWRRGRALTVDDVRAELDVVP